MICRFCGDSRSSIPKLKSERFGTRCENTTACNQRRLRQQARDFEEAHALGYHDEASRDGCPICEDRRNRT